MIFHLKKLREQIDRDTIQNGYVQHILGYQEEIGSSQLLNSDSPHWPFINFIEKAMEYLIYVKELYG